jgi:autotransporter translocation and assembly factor TamB
VTKRRKILLITAASAAGLVIVGLVAVLLVLQSSWFANFVRAQAIAAVEEATGGIAEIGSFQLDWHHLTVRIRNFVLHGTEPRTADPLLRVELLELRVKLFSGIAHLIDLAYLGVDRPEVNLLVFPDGRTNIPEPKVKKPPSNTNSLETVVNLQVGEFQLQNGLLQYLQQKSAFSGRGENLKVLLNYKPVTPSYVGSVSIEPLLLASGSRRPLRVHVNVPVEIDKNTIRVANAILGTDQSSIGLTASLSNLNAPVLEASLNANISLPELQDSFALPIDSRAEGAPTRLTATFHVHTDDTTKSIHVERANVGLGQTTLAASGYLRGAQPSSPLEFRGDLELAQLTKLLKVTSPNVTGAVLLGGKADLDAQNEYLVNGTINTRGVSIRSGDTEINDVILHTPFHADPYLVSLDGVRLEALGGSLNAKIFVEKMRVLSLEGTLRNFSLPVIATIFTGKKLDYDGTIDGTLKATGDLQSKGTSGYSATTRLTILPGAHGVPVKGQLDADYVGARGSVDLGNSYIALPHSRLDLSGALNQHLDLKLVSSNLDDFLPAANFRAKTRQTSLPVKLQGGNASLQAEVKGNLSAPEIASHFSMTNFAVGPGFYNQLALDAAASPSGASVRNGLLTHDTLHTTFDASLGLQKWAPYPAAPLAANLQLRNATVADLLDLAGESSIPASGNVTADIHINGAFGDPLGAATVQVVNGSAYQQPFSLLRMNVDLADRLITLAPLEVKSDAGQIDVTGNFHHPANSFTTGSVQVHLTSSGIQLTDVKPLQQRSPGAAGIVQLSADASGALREVNKQTSFDLASVSADISAHRLRVQNQEAGDLTGTVRTTNRVINYQLSSNFAGSAVAINGKTTLATDYPTSADASIKNLSIAKVLSITGQSNIPATGTASADAHVSGTMRAPSADLTFSLVKADVYQEQINRLSGTVHYRPTLVDVPNVTLDMPAGAIQLTASYAHPAASFDRGQVKFKLQPTDINLAKIKHIEEAKSTLKGDLHLAADLSASISERSGKPFVLFSYLNADASTKSLALNNQNLGTASFTARTSGQKLQFRLDSDVAQSQIHGYGHSELSGDYPVEADLSFSNIKYSNIAPYIPATSENPPSFDAVVEGKASVSGPAATPDQLNARLQLDRLMAETHSSRSPTGAPAARAVTIQNQGPIVVTFSQQVVKIEKLNLAGPSTSVNASGTVNLKDDTAPLNVNLDANINLEVLQDLDRDFYSNGNLTANAAVHGTFSQPFINGRIDLKSANVNYATFPDGLSNANGVIVLTGTGAAIQSLTAETGGGKISLAGFAGLSGKALTYDLRATANRVRARYSGISVTSNANINLIGNSRRSLVSGNVVIERIAYNSSSDAGSILSRFASTPVSTASAPSPMLTGMHLNIHIITAPDLRVSTTYADRLSIEANLTLRGTAATPGMLGQVVVTDGQLVFFGNTYTVNTGTINFYNSNSISPVVNISLQTLAQGVSVTLGVSGPIENLQLSYRSDPPLTFEQIVSLLATNTTPNDPNIVANQPPAQQQSFTQMGESAILSQAVANPLASRVQRVFGLSQFKIDPSVAGNNGQPSARVTLQQKIFNNVTFTYITDVTQTNSEIIRVEWDLTPKFSAVGLRDFNGNVSLVFYYNFKVQ